MFNWDAGFAEPFEWTTPADEAPDAEAAATGVYVDDFAGMDLNSSGLLSRDEWRKSGFSKAMFKRYDVNGDGTISLPEFLAGRQEETEDEAVVWEFWRHSQGNRARA